MASLLGSNNNYNLKRKQAQSKKKLRRDTLQPEHKQNQKKTAQEPPSWEADSSPNDASRARSRQRVSKIKTDCRSSYSTSPQRGCWPKALGCTVGMWGWAEAPKIRIGEFRISNPPLNQSGAQFIYTAIHYIILKIYIYIHYIEITHLYTVFHIPSM